MKLKGILDFSLGNFLCLRGFAPMGVLQSISQPDESFQRVPKDNRLRDVEKYLKKGELVFFPEVILCVTLSGESVHDDEVATFFQEVQQGKKAKARTFASGLHLSSVVSESKKPGDIRSVQYFQTCTLDFDETSGAVFSRIDGNHRLSATKDAQVQERSTPFCIILCRNATEFERFSRALFHNINFKQEPLTMEKNLELILENEDLFSNEVLKTDPSFGWPYYHTRGLHNRIDFDLIPHLKLLIKKAPRTFVLQQFQFLEERKLLGENENAIKRFKDALVAVNALFSEFSALQETSNCGLLSALIYFQLQTGVPVKSFIRWVLNNHLHLIESSSASDLIAIFHKVLESRKRTIFVSMPFGKDETEDHYDTIESVCKEITQAHGIRPGIKVERVDWFQDGTSYVINDKIIEMMSDCGLLIGNLTFCNPNVYHEIGFVMGKAKAEGHTTTNMLLFLDESVAEAKDKYVGFNLAGIKQLRFTKTKEFKSDLRVNIENFFNL